MSEQAKDVSKKQPPAEYPQSLIDLEYQSLRQELLDAMKSEYNTFSVGLSSSALVIGYNLSRDKADEFIFLIPVVILSLVMIHIVESYFVVLNNATYIRIVIEGKEKRWEKWMHKRRSIHNPKTRIKDAIFNITSFEIFFVLRYHMRVAFMAGSIILLGSLFNCILTNRASFAHYSNLVDWKVAGFIAIWLFILYWWVKVSISSLTKLSTANSIKRGNKYEQDLKDWLQE